MVFRVFSKELSDFLFNSLVVLGGETYGIAVLGVKELIMLKLRFLRSIVRFISAFIDAKLSGKSHVSKEY